MTMKFQHAWRDKMAMAGSRQSAAGRRTRLHGARRKQCKAPQHCMRRNQHCAGREGFRQTAMSAHRAWMSLTCTMRRSTVVAADLALRVMESRGARAARVP